MKLTPQDELIKIRQEMLAKEVDAELKNDQIKAFWKKYRFLFIGLACAAVIFVIAFELYQSWRMKTRIAESDQFEQAAVLSYQGKYDDALRELSALSKNAKTGYRYLADLKRSSILIQQQKNEEAFKLLMQLVGNKKVPDELRSVARLSLVGHQIDSKTPEEIQLLLQPLLNESNPFYGSAAELMAISYLKQNNQKAAKNILNQALQSTSVPLNVKQRLSELLSLVEA